VGQDNSKASPGSKADRSSGRKPGRLRSALSVLRGESLVPEQIQWEWAEYQHQFNDLLGRYSASLARAAKAEKHRIEALAESLDHSRQPESRPASSRSHKQELRSRAAALRGLAFAPPPPTEPDAP